jgi:ABC-type transport system involved in multi-copper enzyme maturation permease subunit
VEGPWPQLLGCLLLSALVGSSLGLLISALARSSEVAISLVPIAILPMVVLGGMMQPVHDMGQPARTIAHLIPSRWAFELAISTEAENRATKPPAGEPANGTSTVSPPDLAEPYFPKEKRSRPRTCVTVLAVEVALFLAGTLAILRSRDVHL